MARRTYRFLPLWLLVRARYDALGKMSSLGVPLLVLHGDRDDIVPIEAAEKVFEAAPAPKEFYIIHGAGHNDTHIAGGDGYFEALRRFMLQLSTPTLQRERGSALGEAGPRTRLLATPPPLATCAPHRVPYARAPYARMCPPSVETSTPLRIRN